MLPQSLLVVAKRPAPGHAKTRLCPPLTPEQAAALYECFLRDTLDVMRRVPAVACGIGYLAEAAGEPAALPYFRALAPHMALTPQRGAHLGERLDHLLTEALTSGAARAVVMDSDSPTLPPAYVAEAFTQLAAADVVLGPCDDGGYYLIGVNTPQPRLLREVPMSTPTVLRDTVALAEQIGLRVALLPTWYDVDTVAELARLSRELAEAPRAVGFWTRAYLQDQLRLGEREQRTRATPPEEAR